MSLQLVVGASCKVNFHKPCIKLLAIIISPQLPILFVNSCSPSIPILKLRFDTTNNIWFSIDAVSKVLFRQILNRLGIIMYLNSDGQEFHQYQQNEPPHLTLNNWTHKNMIAIWHCMVLIVWELIAYRAGITSTVHQLVCSFSLQSGIS